MRVFNSAILFFTAVLLAYSFTGTRAAVSRSSGAYQDSTAKYRNIDVSKKGFSVVLLSGLYYEGGKKEAENLIKRGIGVRLLRTPPQYPNMFRICSGQFPDRYTASVYRDKMAYITGNPQVWVVELADYMAFDDGLDYLTGSPPPEEKKPEITQNTQPEPEPEPAVTEPEKPVTTPVEENKDTTSAAPVQENTETPVVQPLDTTSVSEQPLETPSDTSTVADIPSEIPKDTTTVTISEPAPEPADTTSAQTPENNQNQPVNTVPTEPVQENPQPGNNTETPPVTPPAETPAEKKPEETKPELTGEEAKITSFLNIHTAIMLALADKKYEDVDKYIDTETGIYVLENEGDFVTIKHFTGISEMLAGQQLNISPLPCKLDFSELPEFNCSSQTWGAEGCFYQKVGSKDKVFTKYVKDNPTIKLDRTEALNMEKMQRRIEYVTLQAANPPDFYKVQLYFAWVNSKWVLAGVDNTIPCYKK